ncbi:MAG: SufD family Fe-S cluster assembly protein [Actinobacteria bacterium]|nr:SufD family Fe-S cluster assembly protein [Actinomycetota bacterium]
MSLDNIIEEAGIQHVLEDNKTARLVINKNKVLNKNTVPGLLVDTEEMEDGVKIDITLEDNIIIPEPVHLCFGITHKKARQLIRLTLKMGRNSSMSVYSHCVFPFAQDIIHEMDGTVKIGQNSRYSYFEKHIHGEEGSIRIVPKMTVNLDEKSRYKSEFELKRGRAGIIDMDYEVFCKDYSIMDVSSKISCKSDDKINIKETGHLIGKYSRGALVSRIAVRDKSAASIFNKLVATAEYARGHIDCKEIIKDNATASAIPIVEVSNQKAHITHEASIGSVDAKELQTLMSRGLDEDGATELIIEGLLK